MAGEFAKAGKKIDIVIVNSTDAAGNVVNLTSVCTLPIFQDSDKVGAWKEMAGGKDDMYLWDSKGKLVHHLPAFGGSVNTDLGSAAGYKAVKDLVLALK